MKRALVLSLAIIFGLGVAAFGQTLSGTWTVDIKIDATQMNFATALDFSSTLTVNYAVGGWTFGSATTFIDTGWSDQVFTAVGSLGAYLFDSTLDLDPAGAFEKWIVEGGVTMGGMTFGMVFTLYPNDLTLDITASGSTNLVTISGTLSFGHLAYSVDPAVPGDNCDLDWQGITITAGFPFCCADIAATINFTCAGFQYAKFCVTGLTVANIPWLSLDACLLFELESKTLTLTPHIALGEVSCDFGLYADIVTTGGTGPLSVLTIGDIVISGIDVGCTIGGVDFYGISFWGAGAKPSILAGTPYWEAYKISTDDDGCCGPFTFDIMVFFDVNSLSLFDIAEFQADMSLVVASQFKFTMGLTYDVVNALQTWDLGFIVTWP